MPFLVIATLGATLLHVALSAFYFIYSFVFYGEELHGAAVVGIALAGMTLLGVAAGVSIVWSDLHNGRYKEVGVVLAGVMFLGSFVLYFALLYVAVALLLLVLSGFNAYKWRDTGS